jgi:hypothetical protein
MHIFEAIFEPFSPIVQVYTAQAAMKFVVFLSHHGCIALACNEANARRASHESVEEFMLALTHASHATKVKQHHGLCGQRPSPCETSRTTQSPLRWRCALATH